MTANLTPQYRKAEERFRKASDPRERLGALEEMFKELPKHKGTEKMQADLKKKLSEARKDCEEAQAKGGKKSAPTYTVESGGFPQIVVIGAPSAGKSRLIQTLTGTELEVAEYPFTTRVPRPVMMPFEDVRVQLVDTPPIAPGFMEPWMTSIVRAADEVCLVVDLSAGDILESTDAILAQLAEHKTRLVPVPEGEEEIGLAVLPTVVAATRLDADGAADVLEIFREAFGDRFEILPVSCETLEGIEALRARLYAVLDRVRVYPKRPGKPPDYDAPVLLPRGATVLEFAERIHRDLAKNFKRARIFESRAYADGQWVPRDYVVQDRDVLEIEA